MEPETLPACPGVGGTPDGLSETFFQRQGVELKRPVLHKLGLQLGTMDTLHTAFEILVGLQVERGLESEGRLCVAHSQRS